MDGNFTRMIRKKFLRPKEISLMYDFLNYDHEGGARKSELPKIFHRYEKDVVYPYKICLTSIRIPMRIAHVLTFLFQPEENWTAIRGATEARRSRHAN